MRDFLFFFFLLFFISGYKFHDVQYVVRILMWLPGMHLNKLYFTPFNNMRSLNPGETHQERKGHEYLQILATWLTAAVKRLNNYGDFQGFMSHICGTYRKNKPYDNCAKVAYGSDLWSIYCRWYGRLVSCFVFFTVKLVFSSGRKNWGACVPAFSLVLYLPPKALQIMSLCSSCGSRVVALERHN